MRPTMLEINAFGSFAEKTIIDFSLLGTSGIFLISGETGAGKTTIFDSIMFALYGDTTNNSGRDGHLMKSQFVPDSVEAYVKLTFVEKNKSYEIRRAPKQLKGRGKNEKPESVELTLPEGKTITKVSEANSMMASIIGLNSRQFAQIVMLAQGQFSKFLLSPTSEKSELFRTIFNTENYERLQFALSERKKEAYEKYKTINEKQKAIVESLSSDGNEDLERAKSYEILPENILEIIKGIHDDTLKKAISISSAIKGLDEDIRNCETKIANDDERIRKEDLLGKVNAELSLAEEERENLSKEEDRLDEYRVQREAIAEKIVGLKRDFVVFNDLDKEIDDVSRAQKELKDWISRKDGCNISLSLNLEKQEDLTKKEALYVGINDILKNRTNERISSEKKFNEINQICDLFDQISVSQGNIYGFIQYGNFLNSEIERLSSSIQDCRQIIDVETERNKLYLNLDREWEALEADWNLCQEIIKLNAERSKLEKKLDSINADIFDQTNNVCFLESRNYEIFYDTYVSSIASNLRDNYPCPVCGSLHHPNPAKGGNKYTSKDYEKNNEELEEARNKLASQRNQFLEMSKSFQFLSGTIASKFQELGFDDLEYAVNYIQFSKSELGNRYAEKEELDLFIANKRAELSRLESEQKDLIEKKNQNDNKLASENSILSDRSQRLENLNKYWQVPFEEHQSILDAVERELDMAFENESSAQQMYFESLQCEDLKKAIIQEMEEIRNDIHQCDLAITALQTRISNSNRNIEKLQQGLEHKSLTAVQNELEFLNSRKEELDCKITKINEKKSELEKTIAGLHGRISSIRDELEKIEIIDREEVERTLLLSKEKKEEENKRLNNKNVIIQNTENALRRLEKLKEESSVLDSRYRMIKELSDVANGALAGEDRISLETYVQVYFLERILKRANGYLMKMSNGQFQMERSDFSRRRTSQYGLDIDVIDHFSGKKRSVATLSGGEVFKASLALALGMSEEIQERAGSIKMETLYIDEGFGTLDEASLSSSVEVLQNLSKDGKLIGVISHRPELKERIEKQIIVSKKKGMGSSLSFVLE